MSDDIPPIEELTGGAGGATDAGGWLGVLPVALVATGADGRIGGGIRVAQEMLGYRAPEVVGRHLVELLHPGANGASGPVAVAGGCRGPRCDGRGHCLAPGRASAGAGDLGMSGPGR